MNHPSPHQARKRFGQNFLHDPMVLAKMVQAISPRDGQRLVEIGPGLGALTKPLLNVLEKLEVVELDRDVIPHLQHSCAGAGELIIHQADALKFDFAEFAQGEAIRVVGNLPYNISTPLLFHLLESQAPIVDMHFLLQKEVVDRLTASEGKNYGRLSVMAQYHCATDYLFTVGPGAFNPAPKVDSAFVRLVPHSEITHPAEDYAFFAKLVNLVFTQRRKMLRKSLKDYADENKLESLAIDPMSRPETLSVEDFVRLANDLA